MASSCLCGPLLPRRLNTLSLSLGQTVCTPSMHPIMRCLFYSNQTLARQRHRTRKALRGHEKRRLSYQNRATFQGSSPRWVLTSLLQLLSLTDDIMRTNTERPSSFQAHFISFYGCNNSVFLKEKKSQWLRVSIRQRAAKLPAPHQSLQLVMEHVKSTAGAGHQTEKWGMNSDSRKTEIPMRRMRRRKTATTVSHSSLVWNHKDDPFHHSDAARWFLLQNKLPTFGKVLLTIS